MNNECVQNECTWPDIEAGKEGCGGKKGTDS